MTAVLEKSGFWLICIVVFARIIASAAVFDDAYITFRVVDNFTNGYGLRWNIDERVQVYTHPLWMLLHIPLHLIVDNFYIASVLLSFALVGLGICWLWERVAKSRWHGVALVLVPLFLSRTFNAYDNCGLENPLSFCLLVAFVREWMRGDCRLRMLCFLASLLMLTRLDHATLVLPVVGAALWQERKTLKMWPLVTAFSPFILWCVFSLFYYGFIFPNTKFAKLNTGISEVAMVWQGIKYTYNFFYYDTLSFTLVMLVIGNALWVLYGVFQRKMFSASDMKYCWLGAGVALNLLYVIAVGGDYMCGRFFYGAFVVALVVMATRFARVAPQALWLILAAQLNLKTLNDIVITPLTPKVNVYSKDFGINDHHDRYYYMNGLFSDPNQWIRTRVTYPYRFPAYEHHHLRKVIVGGFMGYNVFWGPREMMVIDFFGLTDPLIARLPVMDVTGWRIGHFRRDIPKGYLEVRQSDDTSKMDPDLAEYYAKLRLVTAGPLWDADRLAAIVGFQLGKYDDLLDVYLSRVRH